MHDWFSKTGQAFGGEYRYIQGPGSDGYIRAYNLREHEATLYDQTASRRRHRSARAIRSTAT